jgi:hypothetical protein
MVIGHHAPHHKHIRPCHPDHRRHNGIFKQNPRACAVRNFWRRVHHGCRIGSDDGHDVAGLVFVDRGGAPTDSVCDGCA